MKSRHGASGSRLLAIILIVAGVLGLAYGGFSYTRTTDRADLGPIDISVQDRRHVNIPMWVGIGAIVIGAVTLVSTGRGTRA